MSGRAFALRQHLFDLLLGGRKFALVRKHAGSEVSLFRRCGNPPQDGISVRVSPELRDDLATQAILVRHEAIVQTQLLRRLVDQRLGEGHTALYALKVIRPLAMGVSNHPESLFPNVWQGFVPPFSLDQALRRKGPPLLKPSMEAKARCGFGLGARALASGLGRRRWANAFHNSIHHHQRTGDMV